MALKTSTLDVAIPKEDFEDLCQGLYKLNFSRQVDDAAIKIPRVWTYTPLGESKAVTGKFEDIREGIKN